MKKLFTSVLALIISIHVNARKKSILMKTGKKPPRAKWNIIVKQKAKENSL
jgi:hypothetical protein